MSLLCIKLRSFLGVVLHSDCLSPPSPSSPIPPLSPSSPRPPPVLPLSQPEGRRQQEQEQESPTSIANGSKALRSDAGHFPAHPSRSAGDPLLHGSAVPPHIQQQQQRQTRARSSVDGGASSAAILVPSAAISALTKPVQNIYRKPMSRINSNPSLRRPRDPHFRCNQRLSRHVQLWESDPGDVSYYYSPSGSTQISSGVGAAQGGQGEDDLQGALDYRRRVYTMPSAVPPASGTPRGSCRRKLPRSLEIKRETALARVAGASSSSSSPKERQQLIHNKDVF